jgi:hypothetical protein
MGKILIAAEPLLLLVACETPHSAASTTMAAPTGAAAPAAATSQCHARGVLPDPTCTPGAANPNVTQDVPDSTVECNPDTGTVKSVDPDTPATRRAAERFCDGTDWSIAVSRWQEAGGGG